MAEEEENQTAQIYIELDKHKISGKSYRDNQKKFFLFLLKQPKYRSLVEDFCLNGKPTPMHCIGGEPSLRPNGMNILLSLKRIFIFIHTYLPKNAAELFKFCRCNRFESGVSLGLKISSKSDM
ncbi:Uncharacterised protein [Actinobacillus equuli]|nr:Uncharacterised protein [Actinobacillus equuli]